MVKKACKIVNGLKFFFSFRMVILPIPSVFCRSYSLSQGYVSGYKCTVVGLGLLVCLQCDQFNMAVYVKNLRSGERDIAEAGLVLDAVRVAVVVQQLAHTALHNA